MKTQTDKTQEPQKETVQRAQQESSRGGEATIADNRPIIAGQRKLRSAMGGAEDTTNSIPVQRKTRPERSRRNNTGLPDNIKSGIENLSGYSMDDVKVHYNSNKPAQLQAHAYAQGTDIHLAPGQEKHLPHEAWHVVQQKQGRVKPTRQLKSKVNINDDAGLEREADVMGAKVTQTIDNQSEDISQRKLSSLQTKQANTLRLLQFSESPIQRKLKIISPKTGKDIIAPMLEKRGFSETFKTAYERCLKVAEIKKDKELIAYFENNEKLIKKQLWRWIDNKPGTQRNKSNFIYGRKQQNRVYGSWYDLALGLTGWVKAQPVRRKEKKMAASIYNNPAVEAALDYLCKKLYHKIMKLNDQVVVEESTHKNILKELNEGKSIAKGRIENEKWKADETTGDAVKLGHYQRYYRNKAESKGQLAMGHLLPDNKLTALKNPVSLSVKDKVILLHDLMEYFGVAQKWNPPSPGKGLIPKETVEETTVSTNINENGERTETAAMTGGTREENQRARGKGLSQATRDEKASNTLLARRLNLPIWAGQSMTTVRMLKLAQWVGASKLEIKALAEGIFAYWRLDYDHTSDFAYHTFFEVFDVAKNFGVDYKIKKNHEGYNLLDLKELREEAKENIEDIKASMKPFLMYYRGNHISIRNVKTIDGQSILGEVLESMEIKLNSMSTIINDSENAKELGSMMVDLEDIKQFVSDHSFLIEIAIF